MNTAIAGLLAGILLGVAAAAGGFGGFLLALVLGAVGFVIGGHRDGAFDAVAILEGRHRG
jgi:hypothetical protein